MMKENLFCTKKDCVLHVSARPCTSQLTACRMCLASVINGIDEFVGKQSRDQQEVKIESTLFSVQISMDFTCKVSLQEFSNSK